MLEPRSLDQRLSLRALRRSGKETVRRSTTDTTGAEPDPEDIKSRMIDTTPTHDDAPARIVAETAKKRPKVGSVAYLTERIDALEHSLVKLHDGHHDLRQGHDEAQKNNEIKIRTLEEQLANLRRQLFRQSVPTEEEPLTLLQDWPAGEEIIKGTHRDSPTIDLDEDDSDADGDHDRKALLPPPRSPSTAERERRDALSFYQTRLEGYKKDLELKAQLLRELGEDVGLPFESTSYLSSPARRGALGSLFSKIGEKTGLGEVAKQKQEFDRLVEYYQDTEDILQAVERGTALYRRSPGSSRKPDIAPLPNKVMEEKSKKTRQESPEARLILERYQQGVRDSITTLLTRKTLDGRILGIREITTIEEGTDILASAAKRNYTSPLNMAQAIEEQGRNIPEQALIHLVSLAKRQLESHAENEELDLATQENLENLFPVLWRRIDTLFERAKLPKTLEGRGAQSLLERLTKLVGGRTAIDVRRRVEATVEAAVRLHRTALDDSSFSRLAGIYIHALENIPRILSLEKREKEIFEQFAKNLVNAKVAVDTTIATR